MKEATTTSIRLYHLRQQYTRNSIFPLLPVTVSLEPRHQIGDLVDTIAYILPYCRRCRSAVGPFKLLFLVACVASFAWRARLFVDSSSCRCYSTMNLCTPCTTPSYHMLHFLIMILNEWFLPVESSSSCCWLCDNVTTVTRTVKYNECRVSIPIYIHLPGSSSFDYTSVETKLYR